MTLPPELPGNVEAIFEVVQLPTGEIIDVVLRKSSGVRAYDDAVQRALAKSSPLPRPDRPELFQRTLPPGGGSAVPGRTPRSAAPPAGHGARACLSTIWIAAQLHSARCSTRWRSATV